MSQYVNYDDVIEQLQSIGLIIDGYLKLATGKKSVRCKVSGEGAEKRGWYRLYEWITRSGEVFLTGSYGVFYGDESNTNKIELTKECESCHAQIGLKEKTCSICGKDSFKKREFSDEEKAAFRVRIAEDKKRAEEERKAEISAKAKWATAVWRACRESNPGEHDYLVRKGLEGTGGARIFESNDGIMLDGDAAELKEVYKYLATFHGALVVPLCDENGVVYGLQFIMSRQIHGEWIRDKGRDKEYWPAGMGVEGHYWLIGGTPRGLILEAEGFATGLRLHNATGLPVAIAFAANNIGPVAKNLAKRFRKRVRNLICADDDWLQKCKDCGKYTPVASDNCAHCGKPHGKINAGITRAQEAAIAVDSCAWIAPKFSIERPSDKKGPTDFDDLAAAEGEQIVSAQIESKLTELGWKERPALALASQSASARGVTQKGGGENAAMPSILSVEEAVSRYWCTYGLGGKVLFDAVEYRLVHRDDVMNLIPERSWNDIKRHPEWRVARDTEIGFDPTERDPQIKCNLFSGWPTVPKQGKCTALLELLEYLCANDDNSHDVYQWVLKWLAYPIQNRGAKMHSAIVVHGRQGTGKSRFFEAYAEIFGEYSRVLGQEALEDKFNSDWSEKKLFILADEVLARQDMYHIKNRLKGFITGGTIRVNPKGVAAHNEKNQMNIVFLSNERQPLVLENDDRRHCVIWVPPKLSDEFFAQVNDEIDNGGVAALHHFLLNLDLGDFRPWTKPPMTQAKAELIELSLSSEERFIAEWQRGELEGPEGKLLPFCPCLGSHLYREYERWCERTGERKRAIKDLISFCGKNNGWLAGASTPTWISLINKHIKNRKMVIPSEVDISEALVKSKASQPESIRREKYSTKAEWLTACFFEFANASGVAE